MFKGVSIPISVNVNGGIKKESNSEQIKKLLSLALSEDDDDNPFQDLGLDSKLIYSVSSNIKNAEIKIRINKIIQRFNNRIKLVLVEPILIERFNEGEIQITIKWYDTQSNKSDEFQQTFMR